MLGILCILKKLNDLHLLITDILWGLFEQRFGAKDAKAKSKQKEYDFIMDEEIEFVQVLQMPGTRKNKVTFNLFLIFLFWIYH